MESLDRDVKQALQDFRDTLRYNFFYLNFRFPYPKLTFLFFYRDIRRVAIDLYPEKKKIYSNSTLKAAAERAHKLSLEDKIQMIKHGLDRAKVYSEDLICKPSKEELKQKHAPLFDEAPVPLIMDTLSIKNIIVLPPIFGIAHGFTPVNNVCELPANFVNVFSALASFLMQAQEAIGNPGALSTHPASKVLDYVKFVETYADGLEKLVEWLRVYGCQAWLTPGAATRQADVDNIIRLAASFVVALAYTMTWLLDEDLLEVKLVSQDVRKLVNGELKVKIYNYLWVARELLQAIGAMSSQQLYGAKIRTGEIFYKGRHFTKTKPKAITRGPYAFTLPSMSPDIKYLKTPKFVRAFSSVFDIHEPCGRCIVEYLDRDDMIRCATFIEFYASCDAKRSDGARAKRPRLA